MSFFTAGDRYRDQYLVESTIPFFHGELALARSGDQRFYLQYVRLKKQAPPRAIQQYLNLDHPLVIPHLQVFTEERSLVFIHPHLELRPLSEVMDHESITEDRLIDWAKSLLQLEALLAKQPLPMYLFLHPHNLGLTAEGELKVMFCGVYKVTELESQLNWGSLFYSLLTGKVQDEPLEKLPDNAPVSKPMARLIQRSLKKLSAEKILSQIEVYEKRKSGKGLFSRFRQGESTTSPETKESREQREDKESSRPKRRGIKWIQVGLYVLLVYACISSTLAWTSSFGLLEATKEEPTPSKNEEKIDFSAQVFAKNFAREYFLWSEGKEESRKQRLHPYLSPELDEQAGFSFEELKWNSWARNVEIWSMQTQADQIDVLIYAETQMQNIKDPEKERRVERWMQLKMKKTEDAYAVTEIPQFVDSPMKKSEASVEDVEE